MQQDNAGLIDATMSLTQQLTNLENKTSQAKGGAEQAQRELSCSQDRVLQLEQELEPLRVFEQATAQLHEQLSETIAENTQMAEELADLQQLQNGHSLTWVPDHVVHSCVGCHADFSFTRRRHHCRFCGRVFCSSCTTHQVALPSLGYDTAVRVCEWCVKILPMQGQSDGA